VVPLAFFISAPIHKPSVVLQLGDAEFKVESLITSGISLSPTALLVICRGTAGVTVPMPTLPSSSIVVLRSSVT
jgi:hypothetical protein